MSTTIETSSKLFERLAGLRASVRTHLGLTALCHALVAVVVASGVSLVLDYLFRLSYPTRVVQFLLFTGALIVFFAQFVYGRLVRELPDDELALAVERRWPELDCRLVSAIQFMKGGEGEGAVPIISPELANLVIRDAEQSSQAYDFREVVDWSRLGERGAAGAVSLFIAILVSATFTVTELGTGEELSGVKIWLKRNVLLQDIAWPKATHLFLVEPEVKDGERLVLKAGAPLELSVRAEGTIPDKVFVSWEPDEPSESSDLQARLESGRAIFAKVGETHFSYTFPSVDRSFRLSIRGGDGELGPIRVFVVRPPYLRSLELGAKFPEHTGRPAKVFRTGTADLAVPEGTELTLAAECSKPLESATVTLKAPGEPAIDAWQAKLTITEDRRLGVAVIVTQTLTAKIDVKDRDGLPMDTPTALTFRAIKDKAPKLTIATTGVGNMVTPQAVIPLKLKATDDYGLTGGTVNYRFTDPDPKKPAITGDFAVEAFFQGREADADPRWELEPVGMKPGTFLSFWAEATDNDGLAGAKSGRSQVMTIRVVSREELMNDMIRRQQELRRRFEELIRIETELRDELSAGIPIKKKAFSDARKQLRVARQCELIRRQLSLILEEMRNNRILKDKDLDRLRDRLIKPLGSLVDELLPTSRRSFEELGEAQDAETVRERTLAELEEILALMESIKSQMLRLETLTELITRLEGIIRLWDDVIDDTKNSIEEK